MYPDDMSVSGASEHWHAYLCTRHYGLRYTIPVTDQWARRAPSKVDKSHLSTLANMV